MAAKEFTPSMRPSDFNLMSDNNPGMEKTLFLCMVLLVATAAAEYSFDVVSSNQDSVIFEWDCDGNGDCLEPGEEYCGDSQVKELLCVDEERCEVKCHPIKPKSVDADWTAKFTVLPRNKKAGQELTLEVDDTRNGQPVVCEVEIYYGGRWEAEQVEGATHWGGTITVLTSFINSEYVDGKLIETAHTDRQGMLAWIPPEPGRYVFRVLNSFIVFTVADESGYAYECGNGECERSLGEDETVCPEDCEEGGEDDTEVGPVCGDEVCDAGENPLNCPADCGVAPPPQESCVPEGYQTGVYAGAQDCCQGLTAIGCEEPLQGGICPAEACVERMVCARCGNNECGLGENYCNCPEDCAAEGTIASKGGGEDYLMMIFLVVGIALVVLVAFIIKSGALKSRSTIPKGASTKKCPYCGAALRGNDIFCTSCGKRVTAPP